MAKKKDTKALLLESALELMWSRSYGGVSVDDICCRAKAKKGSFYHYFSSKAELTIAALELIWEELRTQLDHIFSPQTTPLDRLKKYTEFTLKEQVELKKKLGYVVGCPFTSIGSEQCSCDDGVSAKASEILTKVLTYFKSAIKDAVEEGKIAPIEDEDITASRLLTYELGALSFARVANDTKPLEGLYGTWLTILHPLPAKSKAKAA